MYDVWYLLKEVGKNVALLENPSTKETKDLSSVFINKMEYTTKLNKANE